MNMDKDLEFLNYIYQNAEMGKDTLSQLISIVDQASFKPVSYTHLTLPTILLV